jgi:uncharacterized repeat protein (TIGR01451 family)
MAMANLGFGGFPTPSVRQKVNEQNWVFAGGAVSKEDIPVSICYELQADGKVRLAWTMLIRQANTADLWNMRVDAQTGAILSKFNQTVYCKAGDFSSAAPCSDATAELKVEKAAVQAGNMFNATESYNVFPLPTESPAHGNRQLLVNPADAVASPYGWLDNNGVAGAEFTYTRGNNVWAYNDIANDNAGSAAESANGGATLTFDFPYDANAEPEGNKDAATTNLFYMNNMMHDIMYRYGFDEPAGNFQDNNYAHGGVAADAVHAESLDGGGTDNANFSTPADGGNGTMQMYKWNRQGGKIIIVNAPGPVLGGYEATEASGWGVAITTTPVTGNVVVADDGTSDGNLGCGASAIDMTGKIALIDRGVCQFGVKALNAQNAGAIGVIIANFEDALAGMAAGAAGGSVTIPVVMMKKGDCDILRQYAGTTLNVSMVLPSVTGPNQLDGDFDNGIISHEYGHGISTRLTGGPANSGCLNNAEEMGEGWSDWFALANTVRPGDTGPKKRGMGTYVYRESNDGQGIRRYPYSTDMSINPLTFATVAENTEVHALGEVWTAMLWDVYWAMVEKYGFDADRTHVNSGNGRALQLVIDGCKLQPCSPGFVDGRDAIILADILDYNGADTCLISTVFARRGLGYNASQGSSLNAGDGVDNFDPIPTCIKELKIKKVTTTPLVDPAGFADYKITVTNHKTDAVTNLVVTDELPAGLTFVSASNGGTASGGVVSWNIGTMQSGAVLTLTYRAQVVNGLASHCEFRDPMETDDNWATYSISQTHPEFFSLQTAVVKQGLKAWMAPESSTDTTNFVLEGTNPITITGTHPVLRFWNNFNTAGGVDAGYMEIQKDGETKWHIIPSTKMIRNGYPGKVQYQTFAIPFLYGFSGSSTGWVQTYVDLTDYVGQKVLVRYHFGTGVGTVPANPGWFIDDVQVIDLVNFEGQACATSGQGDHVCASMPESGVILNTDCSTTATNEPTRVSLSMLVQPNPAWDMVNLSLSEDLKGPVQVSLTAADGHLVIHQTLASLVAGQTVSLDVQNIPAGMYMVRLEGSNAYSVAKVVVY